MSNGAGKGPRYRPVDRKKWDAWWDQYEKEKKEKRDEYNRQSRQDA